MAKSKLTRSQAQLQYDRAKRLGWIPFFFEAAKTHTHDLFDAADLMAIGSRETNLDPKWLTKAGDGGHGHGLMQIDDRSFSEFTKSEYWRDARLGILYGAKVLRQKWDDTQSSIGKRRIIKGNAFIGKDVGQGYEAQQVAIAAYNCGRWSHYNVSKGKDVDRTTTGKDYSSDVLGRSAQFRELLTADGWFSEAHTNVDTPTPDKPAEIPPNVPLDIKTDTVVEVPTIAAEHEKPLLDRAEEKAGKWYDTWSARWAAIPASLTAFFGGVYSFLTSAPVAITVSLIVSGSVVALVYFTRRQGNADRASERAKELEVERIRLEHDAKMQREARAQELQIALINSAANKDANTVKLVNPPVTEVPNSDAEGETK